MTAQFSDSIRIEEIRWPLHCQPLTDFWHLSGTSSKFISNCTGNSRGYIANWEIKQDRLYLIGLTGTLADQSKATLATLFPDYPDRVFAHWFSGELLIPDGELLETFHAAYGGRWERTWRIMVSRGVIGHSRYTSNANVCGPFNEAPEDSVWLRLHGKYAD